MSTPAPEQMLSAWQVGIAALLILVNGALSIGLGLGWNAGWHGRRYARSCNCC